MLKIGCSTIMILVLSQAQTMRWRYQYNGGGADAAVNVVYTNDHYICAAGSTIYPGFGQDIMLLGLDTLGNLAWGPLYYGGGYTDIAFDLSCSPDGNLYIAGSQEISPDEDFDFIILAATSTGSPTWAYQYDYAASYDEAYSVVQGNDGNVYAAGYNCEQVGPSFFDLNFDFIVIGLTNTGTQRWVFQYNNAGSQQRTDVAQDIVYGDDNNIYAAGEISNDTLGTQSYDFAVVKLTTTGAQRWVHIYNGPINNMDEAYSLIYKNGKLYVAGFSTGGGTSHDITVICLDTLNQRRWVYRYNGPANGLDEAREIIYGGDKNLYICGYSAGTGTSDDFIVISLDTLGNERWVYRKNGSANQQDQAYSIAYGQNRIYACGYTTNTGASNDFMVVSLDNNGNEKWTYVYNGVANSYDQARSIVYGQDRFIYAAGDAAETGTYNSDFTVISLRDTLGIGIDEDETTYPEEKIFNIAVVTTINRTLAVSISSPKSDIITFSIYNTIGQEILTDRISVPQGIAHYSLTLPQNLPLGIYFIKAMAEDKSVIRKFIVVR